MTKPRIIIAALGLPVSADRQKILLTKRHAPEYPLWHNKWQIAGGGLEFGETMEQAVIRELWEELRVKAEVIHPYPIVKSQVWYAKETDHRQDTQVILCAYLVTIGDQVPDLTQDPDWETSAWGWFTRAEAAELDGLPLTYPTVEAAFQLLSQRGIIQE
jgi:8-oxo-dGTP pyrophosphatase MutT (NUDIX family)